MIHPITTMLTSIDVQPLSADDINWQQEPPRWPSSSPTLDVLVDAIPIVSDPLAAEVLTQAAETIADLRIELGATRTALSVALQHLHEQQIRVDNLHRQVIDMREERRARTGMAA